MTIQETIFEVSPALLIESGTNRGGSAFFFACIFDLLGHGQVLTIDIDKMHDLVHPRIEFLVGSSVSDPVITKARERVSAARGPVLIILGSDHSENHVFKELELYAPSSLQGASFSSRMESLILFDSFVMSALGHFLLSNASLKRIPRWTSKGTDVFW